MLTQGVIDQSPFSAGSRRYLPSSTDRVFETNIENLLRMVNYCENDSDCRRLLQLIHFGEKFNPLDCQKTCDSCSKILDSIERDVTDISRQLVELIKETDQQFSLSHILEVYRGSMSLNIKKYKHDTLRLHGAGKHLQKGEASRIIRHLVIMDILVEEVKKSDIYGSISSVLRVNESKASRLYSGEQRIILRFPSPAKAYKSKSEVPLTKASSFTETTSSHQNIPVQAQNEVDFNLSAKLYAALRTLRTMLVKEAGEGVMAYHIFGNATLQQISKRIPRTKEELLEINGIGKAKLLKYGDRVLETIESIIRERHRGSKNSSSSSDNDLTKRRRSSACRESAANDDDFDESSIQSKKRVVKVGNGGKCLQEYLNISSYNDRFIDLELDEDAQNEQI